VTAEREQRLVFGEIAKQYDAARPSYPDEMFDIVMTYGALHAGDRALEIGAGTGKATEKFIARGLHVHALEPSAGMAAVLRTKNVEVEDATFEAMAPADPYALVYAAQSWHWVAGDDKYDRLARALRPGGVAALFWNQGRPHPEPFKTDNDAVYKRLWPENEVDRTTWPPDATADQFAASGLFTDIEKHVVTWEIDYTAAEWVALLQTHSNHRMLPDDVRTELHEGVAAAIEKHGGVLACIYDTDVYLARVA
jgi:SAM-dependent methyltransferase